MSITTEQLNEIFQHHCGTEAYHRINPICNPTNSVFTDGVKAFADKAQAYWFLDIVFSELITRINTKNKPFLRISLWVDEDNGANVEVTNGNGDVLYNRVIEFADLPHGVCIFFFIDGVLMLPNEY